jgi:uncharacterized protein YydD (DUF2326 family)
MTSTPQDKFDQVEKTFQDRINHYYSDMGAANAAEAEIIDRQYSDAEKIYNAALEKSFLGNTKRIEDVTDDLKGANQKVDKLREQNEGIAKILKAVAQAIDLARTLTLIAG